MHKSNITLRFIVFMVNSAYHMLAWRWTKLLEAIHSNIGGQLILKDAFQFSKEMNISDKFVVSFDVCSLSASIPLEETNNIIYEQCEWIPLPQNELRKLFHFQSCNQTDGVAMRSPLRSILADIFIANLEQTKLKHKIRTQHTIADMLMIRSLSVII